MTLYRMSLVLESLLSCLNAGRRELLRLRVRGSLAGGEGAERRHQDGQVLRKYGQHFLHILFPQELQEPLILRLHPFQLNL